MLRVARVKTIKSMKQITTQKLTLLEQSEPVQTNYKGNKTANMILPRLEIKCRWSPLCEEFTQAYYI